MATAPYIFRFVGDALAGLTSSYAEAASSSLASAIAPTAIVGVTLFIAAYGGLIIAGKVQQPFSDFMVKSVKILLVAAFALNAGNYITYVAGAVNGLESGLVSALRAPGTVEAESTYEQLDISMGKANILIAKAFEETSKRNVLTEPGPFVGYALSGIIISTGVVLFFLVGGATIICSKFMLAIMLAIGPLFVMALMWPPTAGFFDRWLGQTLTYVFTIVLVAVVMSMGISIFDRLIAKSFIDGESGAIFVALQILLITLVLTYVTYQVSSLAAGIAGGVSMATLTLRQVAGIATNPAAAAARAINPMSNRLDPRTGLQTSSPRLEHLAQGRSVWVPNPAYRKAVTERWREAMRNE